MIPPRSINAFRSIIRGQQRHQQRYYYSPTTGAISAASSLSGGNHSNINVASTSSSTTPTNRTRRTSLSYSTTTGTTAHYDAFLRSQNYLHNLLTETRPTLSTSSGITSSGISSRRAYVTRAHQPRRGAPPAVKESSVRDAVHQLLKECKQRQKRRERKMKRNNRDGGGHPDEMVELAINLNLDPRKPGQALRGTVNLPHGTGKSSNGCVVFTNDSAVAQQAIEAGALYAGGDDLMDSIMDGSTPLDYNSVASTVATQDMMQSLSKKGLARVLGPRGLMPNAKIGTLVSQPNQLLDVLRTKLAGSEITYRTDKEGIVHVPVGKASFGASKILDNVGEVMKEIHRAKPESYGKGKKKASPTKAGGGSTSKPKTKYLLRASASTTQGKGLRLDLRTIDPSSAFFLTSADDDEQQEEGEVQQQAVA